MPILADEPGLTGAKRLAQSLILDSAVHGLLLYGAPGAGQVKVADALARAWLCTNPGPDGGCGECQACGSKSRGNNPDYQLVKPHGAGQQIKQAAIVYEKNSDLAMVPVRDFVRTSPLLSRHKVMVFHAADKMNKAAASALLKTLEEPQEYMRFVLVTDAIGRILPTILSRCIAVACELPPEAILRELGEAFVDAPHLAPRLSAEAFSSFQAMVAALGTASHVSALKVAEDFEELCESLATEDGTGRQALADGLELLAILLCKSYPQRPDWVHQVLGTHRRVLGNIHAGRCLDALFVNMLS